MKPPKWVQIGGHRCRVELSGPCPCGGQWHAVTQPVAAVLHNLPPCEQYATLEPDEYMKMIREGLEATPLADWAKISKGIKS